MRRFDLVSDWAQLARTCRYDAAVLAAKCSVSQCHLRRFFHAACCCTPQEWLNQLRLWHALELVCSETPTKVVAVDLDFSHPSLLCRHFLKYFKCTPTEAFYIYKSNQSSARAAQIGKEFLFTPWKAAERTLVNRLTAGTRKSGIHTSPTLNSTRCAPQTINARLVLSK